MRVLQAKAWNALVEGFSLLVSYRPLPLVGSRRRCGCEISEARNDNARQVRSELAKEMEKDEGDEDGA